MKGFHQTESDTPKIISLWINCPGKNIYFCFIWASLVAQLVKNLPAMPETWVRFLGRKDPLEKGTATHSSILAWRIPWIICPWGCKELDRTEQLLLHFTGLRPDLQNPNI